MVAHKHLGDPSLSVDHEAGSYAFSLGDTGLKSWASLDVAVLEKKLMAMAIKGLLGQGIDSGEFWEQLKKQQPQIDVDALKKFQEAGHKVAQEATNPWKMVPLDKGMSNGDMISAVSGQNVGKSAYGTVKAALDAMELTMGVDPALLGSKPIYLDKGDWNPPKLSAKDMSLIAGGWDPAGPVPDTSVAYALTPKPSGGYSQSVVPEGYQGEMELFCVQTHFVNDGSPYGPMPDSMSGYLYWQQSLYHFDLKQGWASKDKTGWEASLKARLFSILKNPQDTNKVKKIYSGNDLKANGTSKYTHLAGPFIHYDHTGEFYMHGLVLEDNKAVSWCMPAQTVKMLTDIGVKAEDLFELAAGCLWQLMTWSTGGTDKQNNLVFGVSYLNSPASISKSWVVTAVEQKGSGYEMDTITVYHYGSKKTLYVPGNVPFSDHHALIESLTAWLQNTFPDVFLMGSEYILKTSASKPELLIAN